MLSDKASFNILVAINDCTEKLLKEFEICELTDLKIDINISKNHDPEVSTMIIVSKTDKLHIEQGKYLE